MKAELVYGKWIKVSEGKITLEVKANFDYETIEYPYDMDLDEEWTREHLGDHVELVLIDGKVKNIRIP